MARKNIRLQYNAPVTLTFFFLSLASLVLGYLTNNWTTTHLFSVYRSSMTDPLFYVRLFGHVLGHGGWDHFINNMLLFLVVAPPLEERYGSRTLLSGILMTALVSGILQCVLFPTSALLGASGIVFMLIMLSSLAGSKNGGIPITFILVGVLYLSQQVYSILFIQDNVANFMHMIGGVCGTVFGFAVRKKIIDCRKESQLYDCKTYFSKRTRLKHCHLFGSYLSFHCPPGYRILQLYRFSHSCNPVFSDDRYGRLERAGRIR